MFRTRVARFVSILTVIGFTAAAMSSGVSAAAGPTVFINGDSEASYTFRPVKLNVDRGTKVHWQWDSNAPHNVTFRKLGKKSVTGASETYKLRFKKVGTYRYVCTVHGFRGKVVVSR